jgi:hypothetical protein
MLAPGPNLPTITGSAATPVYLGIGPSEYFDPELTMPDGSSGPDARAAQIAWLRRAAVSHVLSFEPLGRDWPADFVWSGFDPLLNRAWGRFNEPIYLHALRDSRPRAGFDVDADGSAAIAEYSPDRIVIDALSDRGGRLVLRDLFDPGWTVSIDGKPAESLRHEGMFRAVDVPAGRCRVEWIYRPTSVRIGALISVAALGALIALALPLRFLRRVPEQKSATEGQ